LLLVFHQTHNLSRNKFPHVARQVEGFCTSYFAALTGVHFNFFALIAFDEKENAVEWDFRDNRGFGLPAAGTKTQRHHRKAPAYETVWFLDRSLVWTVQIKTNVSMESMEKYFEVKIYKSKPVPRNDNINAVYFKKVS